MQAYEEFMKDLHGNPHWDCGATTRRKWTSVDEAIKELERLENLSDSELEAGLRAMEYEDEVAELPYDTTLRDSGGGDIYREAQEAYREMVGAAILNALERYREEHE